MSDQESKSIGTVDFAFPTTIDAILDSDVDGLLDAPEKAKVVTSSDRLERAFLEVVEFRRSQGRLPDSQTLKIAERKLGARLDGILADNQKIDALKAFDDEFGLLTVPEAPNSLDDLLGGDGLGLLADESGLLDMADLPVRKAPSEVDFVAKRTKSMDFDRFEHLFKDKHAELAARSVRLVPFKGLRMVTKGQFFVLGGVMLVVAEVGEPLDVVVSGKTDQKQRLRVIFENGTESDMYRHSLSTRLFEQAGQAIVPTGISVDEVLDGNDIASGYIYVLKSLSDDPQISGRNHLHKIGFSRGNVSNRIKNAEKSSTYLMAPVEIVASYQTINLNVAKFENLLHRVFAEVRLDLTQVDQRGKNYDPSEWFEVPYSVIDQAVELIVSGEIVHFQYDAQAQRLVSRKPIDPEDS